MRTADAAADEAAETLDLEAPIANTMPVLEDQEGLRRYFLPDELTVQFRDDVSDETATQLLRDMALPVVHKQRTKGYYTVGVPAGRGLFETIAEAARHPRVLFAEPSEFGLDDALRDDPPSDDVAEDDPTVDGGAAAGDGADPTIESADALDIPFDADFARLWGLHNTGQTVNGTTGSIDADIDAPRAWEIETGRKNVVVAVIDTGCDLEHPDLQANILPRGGEDWDFADPADDEPWDSGSHGTHVCGTVAARRNRVGVVGAAPGVWLMPLRVNLTSGRNQNRADAINYVAEQAVRFRASRRYVINCSWRMNGDHAGVRNAIRSAVRRNVVVVFAAGNANRNIDTTPQYPAVYAEVMAVAATDQRDRRATFSNYGGRVDISAPGVNILSTVPDDGYGFKNGTSMAAPHVAGVAALIRSRNPDLSVAEVRRCLETTADNIDARNPGFVGQLGGGRLNALRALLHVPPRRLPTREVTRFRFPRLNAGSSTGLAYVERFPLGFWGYRRVLLFLTQQAGTERIYILDPTSGSVLGSVDPAANDTIGSLAWDGSAFRVANVTTGAGAINRINRFSGAQIGSIPAPPGRGEGLVVVGPRTYYSTVGTIHELRTATGQVLRSFPAPEGQSRALTYGRGLLFSGDSDDGTIVAFDRQSLSVRGHIGAPGTGGRRAEGLAFDSRRRVLYVANQSENTIYALRVSGL